MIITYRKATLSDIPRIIYLTSEVMANYTYKNISFSPERMAAFLFGIIKSDGFALAALADDLIIGGMIGEVLPIWYSNDLIGYEHTVFLQKNHRNGRITMRMIKEFELWCELKGAKQIRTGITTGDNGISRLYEKLGFDVVGSNFMKEI